MLTISDHCSVLTEPKSNQGRALARRGLALLGPSSPKEVATRNPNVKLEMEKIQADKEG